MKNEKVEGKTPKGLLMALKAAGVTVDVASGAVAAVFKVFGSILLVLLITEIPGLMQKAQQKRRENTGMKTCTATY